MLSGCMYRYLPPNSNKDNANPWIIRNRLETTSQSFPCYSVCLGLIQKALILLEFFSVFFVRIKRYPPVQSTCFLMHCVNVNDRGQQQTTNNVSSTCKMFTFPLRSGLPNYTRKTSSRKTRAPRQKQLKCTWLQQSCAT